MAGERALSLDNERARRIDEKLRRELGPVVCAALEEPDVVEVVLNADGRLWVERLGARGMTPAGHLAAAQAEAAMTTIAASLHTTITREAPILECELPLDGSRFAGLLPPVVAAPVFAIRRKASRVFTLESYVRQGMMSEGQAAAIREGAESHRNILVVGGTGSGKTTLLNAIIEHIVRSAPAGVPPERLVIIEDTAEVQCSAENATLLRATDTVDMLRLLRATLRLRPDRILVGEVRGPEAHALLKSWNTGHPGGVATVHANSALAGLVRLEQLVAEATSAPTGALIAEAVDLLVYVARTAQGRAVEEVLAVEGFDGGRYLTERLA